MSAVPMMPTGMSGHPVRSARRPDRCGPCGATRHASACPRGRCRRARPARARRRRRSAPLRSTAAERSIGIMPIAGKRNFVFQASMYSALPTKVMRRGTDSSRNESRTEMWFGQRIAPPVGRQAVQALDLHLPEHALDRRAEGADHVLHLAGAGFSHARSLRHQVWNRAKFMASSQALHRPSRAPHPGAMQQSDTP